MPDIKTEAWVLHRGPSGSREPGVLQREIYSFPDITNEEVLAEPLYGSWEGNMSHALDRDPVDVCRLRREDRVVLGNSGVLRILKCGRQVTTVAKGDLCVIVPSGTWDRLGYLLKVVGYYAPHTIGVLAKQIKLHEKQVMKLPANSKYSLSQWAAFSVRYGTAWSNWKVAFGCLRLQLSESEDRTPHVWGWGGGTALAEVSLAKLFGCRGALISSKPSRLRLIEELGITPIDRRRFAGLDFDAVKYEADREYRKRYLRAEASFLEVVRDVTQGAGVSVFIDNIGTPVFRATLKALARQGVVTTIGWKRGSSINFSRSWECTNRHIHVHTHGSGLDEGADAVTFAESRGWVPPVADEVHEWEDIPQLANDYGADRIDSYFPVFKVNAV